MKMTQYDKDRDAYFRRQYVGGGFCGDCGEATKPILNNDIKTFGECPFNGDHPKKANPKGHSIDVNGYCNLGCC